MESLVPAAPVAEVSISAADLRECSYPSPEFQAWVRELHDNGRLNTILQAVLKTGRADSLVGAVGYLGQVWMTHPELISRVTVGDIEHRSSHSHHFTRLLKLIGQAGRHQDPHLYYGLVSHQAVYDLLTGQLSLTGTAPVSNGHHQARLWETAEVLADEPVPAVSTPPPIARDQGELDLGEAVVAAAPGSYEQRLSLMYRAWRRAVMEGGKQFNLHPRIRPSTAAAIRVATQLLFPRHAQRLRADYRDPQERWRLLSYLSWGAAVRHFRHERRPRILFREVPVINSRHQIGGGRIDAIEVTAINGRAPRANQRRILAAMARRRYVSSGELLRALSQTFQKHLELTVIDWKFLVGDIVISDRQSTLPDISGAPLPDHLRQMRRYLMLTPFDSYLDGRQETLWETTGATLKGQIWYLLPSGVTIHPVTMTPEERRTAFTENVAMTWSATQRRAALRQRSNAILNHLIEALSGSKRNGNGNGHQANGQPELFSEFRPATAHEVIEAHRRDHRLYVDQHQMLEIVGQTKRGPRYVLHFDHVLEAIHRGDIPAPRTFNPARGGHTICLFPDHDDSTPSFHIRTDRQTFFCFGCERGGQVLPESIPDGYGAELALDMARPRTGSSGGLAKNLPRNTSLASDEHHRVMSMAQDMLAASLRGSSGQKYLTVTRGLDLDLAIKHGAGFGDDRLINGLMDLGLSLDELQFYGFIGFSDRVSTRGGIVPLLRRRGIKDEHMVRPTNWSTKQKIVLGMPYSVLQSRVTFPLELRGRHNNFYGRSVNPCDKRFTHRKLSIQATRVYQGGFRLGLLDQDPPPAEIIVAEGAIDALSLMRLGESAVIAMIGVANIAIVEALAGFTGNFAIAFDYDSNKWATGQTKTTKLMRSLQSARFRGQVRDYTAEFMAKYPGKSFKDYNQFWVDELRQQLRT